MKLNLSVGKPPINGYTNIDLATQSIDFNNMNSVCEAAECTELLIDESLQYLPLQQVQPILNKLITRLRKNGKMIVIGFDLNEVIKMYLNGIMSVADFNYAVFGNNNPKKCSCVSHTDIQNLLTIGGLKIISVNLNTGKFTIVAQRPN